MLQVVLEPTPPFIYAIKAFHCKVTTKRVNGRRDPLLHHNLMEAPFFAGQKSYLNYSYIHSSRPLFSLLYVKGNPVAFFQ